MKRLLTISMLLVSLSIAFAGCSSSSTSTPSASQTPSPSATTTATPTPTPSPSPSGVVYQDFEGSNDPSTLIDTSSLYNINTPTLDTSTVNNGSTKSIKIVATNSSNSFKVICNGSWSINLNSATKISLYMHANPTQGTSYWGINLGMTDNSDPAKYAKAWVANTTTGQWTKITVPFSSLVQGDGSSGMPDYSNINSIWIEISGQGTFYIDDIVAEP